MPPVGDRHTTKIDRKVLSDIAIFDKDAFTKIANKRNEALERNILIKNQNDWVSATLNYNGKTFDANLRLKGIVTKSPYVSYILSEIYLPRSAN